MEGTDLTLTGTGETVYHCLQAAKELRRKGIEARVVDMHTLEPADTEIILKAARETGMILTAEEHSIYGELGAIVSETVVQHCPVPVRILGIPDENAIHGKPLEIFRHYGIDARGIYRTALEMIGNNRSIRVAL